MVSHCANPKCAKPLHYLRDGKIFVFDVSGEADGNGKRSRRMEHYWLCGECCQTLAMEQSPDGVRVVMRVRNRVQEIGVVRSAMAS